MDSRSHDGYEQSLAFRIRVPHNSRFIRLQVLPEAFGVSHCEIQEAWLDGPLEWSTYYAPVRSEVCVSLFSSPKTIEHWVMMVEGRIVFSSLPSALFEYCTDDDASGEGFPRLSGAACLWGESRALEQLSLHTFLHLFICRGHNPFPALLNAGERVSPTTRLPVSFIMPETYVVSPSLLS